MSREAVGCSFPFYNVKVTNKYIVEKFEKACKEFEQDMNTGNTPLFMALLFWCSVLMFFLDGYEIYHHPGDKFAYDVTLARANLLANKNERYQLKVCPTSRSPPSTPLLTHLRIPRCVPASLSTSYPYFINPTPPIMSTPIFPMSPPPAAARACLVSPRAQRLQLYVSHSAPKMFACYVKYSAPNTTSTTEALAPRGSSWDTAWMAYERFFKLKTGKDWTMRHYKWDTIKDAFVYTSPRQGEPQGMFLNDTTIPRLWLS